MVTHRWRAGRILPSIDTSTLQGSATTTTLDLRSVRLVVVAGNCTGRAFDVAGGSARMGAAEGNDVRLDDPHVSRVHCEVRVRTDGVLVVDLGSRNGTWVNDVRVETAHLEHGSAIRVGSSILRVEFAAPTQVAISARVRFGGLIGASLEMRRLYGILERVAPTAATVLLRGETGTGKELAARAIHEASPRRDGPFVAVDCGAIASTLIESELFGHVRGAFSGALSNRKGLIEEAHGGTLFLDEVGELPLPLQPRLLRALEAREVRPVGANTTTRVDVRVIAATNRPLGIAVNEGAFREDLYYRLAVVEIELPPLRARRGDIALLAREFNDRFGPGTPPLPREVISSLTLRGWPGNVRELRNFVERGAALGWQLEPAPTSASEDEILPLLEPIVRIDRTLADARAEFVTSFERAYVKKLLEKSGGNVSRAAELAGVHRRTIQRLMVRASGDDDDDDAPATGR